MDELAETLQRHGLSRCDRRGLYRYRQFYLTYPQIVEAVTPQSVPGLERLTMGPASSAKNCRIQSATALWIRRFHNGGCPDGK